jgi:hypothetical protein
MGVEDREEIKIKSIEKLFNTIIPENLYNLESHPGAGSL